jgi:hypothetical protein
MVGRTRHLPIVKKVYGKFKDQMMDWKFRKVLSESFGAEAIDKVYKDYNNGLNNSLNFQIQSLSASIVNRAAMEINRRFIKDDGKVQECKTLAMGLSIYPTHILKQIDFPWCKTTESLSQDSYLSQKIRDK